MKAPVVYRILTFLILGLIGAQRYALTHKPKGVEEYHRSVRESVKAVPDRIGGWVGQDVPVPAQAIKVLDPNLMVSKRFTNIENGLWAGFMLVHCSDAHDMAGHFPLRCYPARGWDLKSARPHQWTIGGLSVSGMEYEFTMDSKESGTKDSIFVCNFLLRPNGKIFKDMNSMTETIIGAGGQAEGAAQVQVYFDPRVPVEKRDAAVETIVQGYRPVIDAVLAPASK